MALHPRIRTASPLWRTFRHLHCYALFEERTKGRNVIVRHFQTEIAIDVRHPNRTTYRDRR